MAKFVFTCTITIEGDYIRSKKDAINELSVMLNDYDDMNEEDVSICIQWNDVKKEK